VLRFAGGKLFESKINAPLAGKMPALQSNSATFAADSQLKNPLCKKPLSGKFRPLKAESSRFHHSGRSVP
jgi:hypothetical protein